MKLTKTTPSGITLKMRHFSENTFEIFAEGAFFTTGRGAVYSDGNRVAQPTLEHPSAVMITKAEMERLGTYKLYINGQDVAPLIFGPWQDEKGRTLIFHTASDFYYYFCRPDCTITQVHSLQGVHTNTIFHRKDGESKF